MQLFHALVGNWDYAISPGSEGLRNTDVIELATGELLPVAGDFDLASWVTGEVRLMAPREYHPELPEVDRETRYKLEEIKGQAPLATFTQASARFALQRAALEARVNSSEIDNEGRTNALRHVTAFFDALITITK